MVAERVAVPLKLEPDTERKIVALKPPTGVMTTEYVADSPTETVCVDGVRATVNDCAGSIIGARSSAQQRSNVFIKPPKKKVKKCQKTW